MALTELLNEKNIVIPLKSCDRDSVIREMVEHMSAASYVQNPEIVIKSILDRENMGSTGLDKGIAVPHARTHEVADLCVALGISSEGVEYNALDGEDSRLFFMILAPPDQSSQHIRILTEIAGISKNTEMLKSLINARTIEDVLKQFLQ
jgi:nitrogen PTS system EIIA component